MSDEAEAAIAEALICPPAARVPARSRARTRIEIRSLARSQTRKALKVLVGIMRSDDATPAARLAAANAILDRGWGKAAQPIEQDEAERLDLLHRIERIIVHPKPSVPDASEEPATDDDSEIANSVDASGKTPA